MILLYPVAFKEIDIQIVKETDNHVKWNKPAPQNVFSNFWNVRNKTKPQKEKVNW
jgi:hypothetical protein